MNKRILSLQESCLITLLRHHTSVEDISFVPYRLIQSLLRKVKAEQLIRLELTNPLIIFEDDEIWHNLIKKDFDPEFTYHYTSKKSDVLQYFKLAISDALSDHPGASFSSDVTIDVLKNFVELILIRNKSGLYRIPCRLVYEKLREEISEKDKRIAAKVRETTQRIQQEKKQIQITAMKEPGSVLSHRLKNKLFESKSKVFVESLKDSQKRRQQFKASTVRIEKRVVQRVAFGGQAGVSDHKHPQISSPSPGKNIIQNSTNETSFGRGTGLPTATTIDSNITTTERPIAQKRRMREQPKKQKKSRLFGSHKLLPTTPSSTPVSKVYIHER